MSLPQPSPTQRPADWEAFYRDYRKPGYVSGFEITTKLGGGMFGLVFRARKQSIGKDYAIKFLQVDDSEVRRAVLAELEQVKYFAQIDHPNLVSIEDRGEVDGIPYLVMAFAGTETLRDRMPATGNPPAPAERDELLRFFLQACRGLAALHERSLVHFDIKPANVFLKGAVARLGDYGLSKLITHSRGSLSMGRGTPYYMAPEMLQRRGDHKSDVYSLGVMLYEILCGRVPFTGESEWEVLRKHETEAAVLPAHLSALERAVLQRCLQKDPAARYQSVHDLIAAFGAPSGVGAAAWTDVRAGAGTAPPPPPSRNAAAPPVPPPLPSPLPPPLSEDPYAGFGRASREAARHAAKIARKAMVQARYAAQRAAKNANKVMRETMARSRHHGFRRWRAWKRLREQRRTDKEQRDALRAAAAAAPPRRRGPGLLGVAALVAGGLLIFPVLFVASGAPVSLEPEWVETGAVGRPVLTGHGATFSLFRVPHRYEGFVSMGEPEWVQLADEDRSAAATALEAHLARIRAAAPLEPAARAAANVPTFGMTQNRLPGEVQAALQRVLEQFLRAPRFEPELAAQLEQFAPTSMAVAAEQLAEVKFSNRRDMERARRLQRFLEQATCCRDIVLVDDETLTAKDLARANHHLGELWKWYVNEVAHTPRTWQAFKELRAGR